MNKMNRSTKCRKLILVPETASEDFFDYAKQRLKLPDNVIMPLEAVHPSMPSVTWYCCMPTFRHELWQELEKKFNAVKKSTPDYATLEQNLKNAGVPTQCFYECVMTESASIHQELTKLGFNVTKSREGFVSSLYSGLLKSSE